MVELEDRKVDIMIALLGKLVAANTDGDHVLALNSAGLKPAEIARILQMSENAVGKRIRRSRRTKR